MASKAQMGPRVGGRGSVRRRARHEPPSQEALAPVLRVPAKPFLAKLTLGLMAYLFGVKTNR